MVGIVVTAMFGWWIYFHLEQLMVEYGLPATTALTTDHMFWVLVRAVTTWALCLLFLFFLYQKNKGD